MHTERDTERESERAKGGGVERQLFSFLTHIDIETAKIVRFLQFKLFCEANNKKI